MARQFTEETLRTTTPKDGRTKGKVQNFLNQRLGGGATWGLDLDL